MPAFAEALGRELGATVVAEPADVLAAGVDGVVIASSTATHPDLIRACVRAGIPTFCEKPVAQSCKEAVALRDELVDSDVPVQIGFPRRFDPAYVAARDDLLAGQLGYLHTVRSTTLDPAPPPEAYIRRLRRHLQRLRDPRLRLHPVGHRAGGRRGVRRRHQPGRRLHRQGRRRRDGDLRADASGGTLAVVSNTRSNGRGHDVRLELLGSADSVSAGLDERLPLRSADAEVTFPAGQPWEFFMDRFADAFRAELTAFTEVVAGTRTSPCTVADGVEAA